MTFEEVQKKYAETAIEVGHKTRQIIELHDAVAAMQSEIDLLAQDLIRLSKKGMELQQEKKDA